MSGWVILDALEYLGKFSVLVAVIFYFAESGDRRKQKHYQAWQVINTAQGKGGSGGRIEALQELNHDRVPLVGVDLEGAFLQGLRLRKANLVRADLSAADARNSAFIESNLTFANLLNANLRESNLQRANLQDAVLRHADLFGADLSAAILERADLAEADLRATNWDRTRWQHIRSIKLANLHGIHHAPAGFLEWARAQGAVELENDNAWDALLNH